MKDLAPMHRTQDKVQRVRRTKGQSNDNTHDDFVSYNKPKTIVKFSMVFWKAGITGEEEERKNACKKTFHELKSQFRIFLPRCAFQRNYRLVDQEC